MGLSIKERNKHSREEGQKRKRKKQASLCSDKVAWGRGWHSRERKL
jgi:hypothetical protein